MDDAERVTTCDLSLAVVALLSARLMWFGWIRLDPMACRARPPSVFPVTSSSDIS